MWGLPARHRGNEDESGIESCEGSTTSFAMFGRARLKPAVIESYQPNVKVVANRLQKFVLQQGIATMFSL